MFLKQKHCWSRSTLVSPNRDILQCYSSRAKICRFTPNALDLCENVMNFCLPNVTYFQENIHIKRAIVFFNPTNKKANQDGLGIGENVSPAY